MFPPVANMYIIIYMSFRHFILECISQCFVSEATAMSKTSTIWDCRDMERPPMTMSCQWPVCCLPPHTSLNCRCDLQIGVTVCGVSQRVGDRRKGSVTRTQLPPYSSNEQRGHGKIYILVKFSSILSKKSCTGRSTNRSNNKHGREEAPPRRAAILRRVDWSAPPRKGLTDKRRKKKDLVNFLARCPQMIACLITA